jgi:CRP-like cAMP-binding protein
VSAEVETLLLCTPLLQDLSADAVRELVPHLSERQFPRGASVWIEGDVADAIYIVAEGQLKSFRVSRDGAEVILRLHPAGDFTGEVGLFHPSGHRQVSLTAMEPTRCLVLRREPLLAFIARHPPALERLLERLSSMAVSVVDSFSTVAFGDIRYRVARALLALADEFGEPQHGAGVQIRLLLSQGTLAAVVAASRENVNRALAPLIAAGVVSHQAGHFHIHDLAALRTAVEAEEFAADL